MNTKGIIAAAAEPINLEGQRIGADLRALRKARGLTLTELALKVGRSVGFLSQVERGLSEPSISDLRRLGGALGAPLGFFFHNDDAPEAERGWIVRAGARRALGGGAELTEELLSPDLGGEFELVRSVFAPGAELAEPTVRETEEAGYVISGVLELELGGVWFRLNAGDSFRFRREPFRWRNPEQTPCVAIWVIAPPVY